MKTDLNRALHALEEIHQWLIDRRPTEHTSWPDLDEQCAKIENVLFDIQGMPEPFNPGNRFSINKHWEG